MAKDFGEGLFTMDFIRDCEKMELIDIRCKAYDMVQRSTATVKNKQQATLMLNTARTKPKLLIAMANFNLSHSGLKTIS